MHRKQICDEQSQFKGCLCSRKQRLCNMQHSDACAWACHTDTCMALSFVGPVVSCAQRAGGPCHTGPRVQRSPVPNEQQVFEAYRCGTVVLGYCNCRLLDEGRTGDCVSAMIRNQA